MIAPSTYKFASEFYIVEKTVELVLKIADQDETIRIEALYHPPSRKYHTRAYMREHYTIQPTYPQTGKKFDRKSEEKLLWVDFSLPWTDRSSADDAITQAIGFLQKRCG